MQRRWHPHPLISMLRCDTTSGASTDVTWLRLPLCPNIETGGWAGRRRATKCRLINSINRLSTDLPLLTQVANHTKSTSVLQNRKVYSPVHCASDPNATSLDCASALHVCIARFCFTWQRYSDIAATRVRSFSSVASSTVDASQRDHVTCLVVTGPTYA